VVGVMGAERLSLRAGWFDVVCCASAIYFLGHPARVWRGGLGGLRPGGRLALSEFGDLDARWAWKEELLGRLGPPLEPLGGGAPGSPGAAADAVVGRRGHGLGPGRAVGRGLRRRGGLVGAAGGCGGGGP